MITSNKITILCPALPKEEKPDIFKKNCAVMSILQICDCHTVMVILYKTADNAHLPLIHFLMFFTWFYQEKIWNGRLISFGPCITVDESTRLSSKARAIIHHGTLAGLFTPRALKSSILIKKKIKFSSYIRKFWMEQLQIHIWLTASSYMRKYLRISSSIRKPFLIYNFATAPFWISLYMQKILFSFLSVHF